MEAVLLEGPGSLRRGQTDAVVAPAGWVTVKPLFVGLCGSDIHLFDGQIPAPYPVAIGHEIAGLALDGPLEGRLVAIDPVEGCQECDRCLEGHENICADVGIMGGTRHGGLAAQVTVRGERIHPVPDGVTPQLAATTEAVAVAVHAVSRSRLRPGDVVIVLGGGPIGLMIAIAARDRGASRVIVSEPAPPRRKLAQELGFETSDPRDDADALTSYLDSRSADVGFDTAAQASLAPTLTHLVRSGGTVVVVGGYGGEQPVDLRDLVAREIDIVGTRAITVGDTVTTLDLLARRGDEIGLLVDEVVGVDEVQAALERLRSGEATKILVDCSGLQ
jgi:(R,R)-butanediol dehydrogenase / meso-butanediol dehydrogenase / diacetyl reductase